MGAKLCPSLRQRAAARPGFAKLGPPGLLLGLKSLPGKVRNDGNAEGEPSRTSGDICSALACPGSRWIPWRAQKMDLVPLTLSCPLREQKFEPKLCLLLALCLTELQPQSGLIKAPLLLPLSSAPGPGSDFIIPGIDGGI